MNTIKHVVTEVVGEPQHKEWPEENLECWTLKVMADSYGRIGEHTLTFDTKEQAEEVEEGYTFYA